METDDAIYFYGHQNLNGYLSNFSPSVFIIEGEKYLCMEQYIMREKQIAFDPDNNFLAQQIMSSKSAATIKSYGRKVNNFNNEKWKELREDVALLGLYNKFSQNPKLKEKLLSTKDKQLYEASPTDKIWGIGYSATSASNINKSRYGLNLLGNTLMEVRNMLKNEN